MSDWTKKVVDELNTFSGKVLTDSEVNERLEEHEKCCPKEDKIKHSVSYRIDKENDKCCENELYNATTKLLPEVLTYYKTTLHSRESMISILERENDLLKEKVDLLARKLSEYEQAAEDLLISKMIPKVREMGELELSDKISLLFEETPSKAYLEEQTEMLRAKNRRAINGESVSTFRRAK